MERGERQVRWKNRGFERFIGSVCSFHALQAQRRRCGETLTHIRPGPDHTTSHTVHSWGISVIFLLIKSVCERVEFELDVRSRHVTLQVNEWQIYAVVFPFAPLSARLMTRLHNTTESKLPPASLMASRSVFELLHWCCWHTMFPRRCPQEFTEFMPNCNLFENTAGNVRFNDFISKKRERMEDLHVKY